MFDPMAEIRYGVLTPADIAERTGRQLLQAVIDGDLPQPPIGNTLSFLLAEVGDGFAVFIGQPGEHLLNPVGGVHGGWALTLIDSAGACAAISALGQGLGCTTIETKANFPRPITSNTGVVRAEGRVVSQGRTIISTEVRVLDQQGKVLAHGTSTLMVVGGPR